MGSSPDMDELILRVLQVRATDGERSRLDAWLQASSGNRAHFDELRSIWRVAGRASPPLGSATRPDAEELVFRQAPRQMSGGRSGDRNRVGVDGSADWGRRLRRSLAPLTAAAAILAVATGLHVLTPDRPPPDISFNVAEFSTGPTETVTVRLEDGTIVRLGPSSGLQVGGTGGERNVWLHGQAFFAVAHRGGMPFTVRTRAGTATVLGTRFDIRVRDDDFRLVVVDGLVRVESATPGQPPQEVGPSEMSRVIDGGRLYVSRVPDVHGLLEWMEGALIFQSTPLAQAAEELERRYEVPVEIIDTAVASRTITAWFTDHPMEEAVRVICRAADVICEASEAGVRIGL